MCLPAVDFFIGFASRADTPLYCFDEPKGKTALLHPGVLANRALDTLFRQGSIPFCNFGCLHSILHCLLISATNTCATRSGFKFFYSKLTGDQGDCTKPFSKRAIPTKERFSVTFVQL
jgi:hypothetical protein